MKTLVSCAQATELDRRTRQVLQLDELQLMESASLGMFRTLSEQFADFPSNLVALCGKGNNGGDGLALMRHAAMAGHGKLTAIVSSRKSSDSNARQMASARAAGVVLIEWSALDTQEIMSILSGADCIIDAISGTGIAGPVSGEALEMVELLRKIARKDARPRIVSLDLPSGLSDSWLEGHPIVHSDITLALEPMSSSLFIPQARLECGQIAPVGGVFPPSLVERTGSAHLLEATDIDALIPQAEAGDYKTTRGRLALFAGSLGTPGAAVLACRAAQAAGAGYLTLYTDEELLDTYAASIPSVVLKAYDPDKHPGLHSHAVLAGPGWGSSTGRSLSLRLLWQSQEPLVLDADAIVMAGAENFPFRDRSRPVVLTPHPGETDALLHAMEPRYDFVNSPLSHAEKITRICERFGCIAVIKSHVTWIAANGKKPVLWDGLTPELGVAGSGDVLSGLLAGLAARIIAKQEKLPSLGSSERASRFEALFQAACAAVAIHGVSGKSLAEEKGWFGAETLVDSCAKLLHEKSRKLARKGVTSA